ncbi:MAG: SLBB domain-containing protein, partial [Deltaproteobacteria bacterium]|nr:SLBB domain-containing protein [Deltaproteobacteria bacterium]
MPRINSSSELKKLREDILASRDPKKPCITLCSGSACQATGSGDVAASIEAEIEKQGLEGKVEVRKTGCHGFCERGPIIVNHPKESCYFQLTPEVVPEIVSQAGNGNKIVESLLYTDPETDEKITFESEIPFYKHQERLVFGSNGSIDPKSIDDYLAIGGYAALEKALFKMNPEGVLEEVKKSNLRGRGGGGFPTGRKWEESRKAPGDIKYVIVNADEGDPGAYMDRSLLEGNPHSVLEGLMIGAYSIGSSEGYVYVRQEYPLAVENLAIAIEQAEEYGFLGENILGSGFNFRVIVHKGAGAFVCGESSALMTALEGRTGEPRPKYIHTAVKGVWDNPSVLNNVETWANIPLIINKGADWFSQIGTEKSKGTKIFSLVGKITNTGLVEVPMGMTLRDIIYKIGGGIPGGKKFKAVQTGGPSGGCIPEKLLDLEVGFDELTKAGSMMGSGGMIVMDEDTCMVDVARYFIEFLTDESCGKCVPCREGLRQMLKILTNITEGKGVEGDIELLEELSEVAKEACLCALGTSAPNPF